MKRSLHHSASWILATAAALAACGNAATDEAGVGGTGGVTGGAGGATAATSGSGGASTSGSSGSGTGGAGTGGAGGSAAGSGGGSDTPAVGGAGGTAVAGTGGSSGAAPQAGSSGSGGSPVGCTVGPWPEADPAVLGPFATVTEMDVGPRTGEGENEGELVGYTLFRPEELGAGGRCHPVITWGNGSGANPGLYGVLLRHLASHGFVVIASDSPSVATGDPPPMIAGVSWVLEQNADPASPLYRHIDPSHVGATGHSLGGFATTQAASNSLIKTIAPVCGAASLRTLHGPAFLMCGGMDEVVECSGIESAFESIDDQPAMFGNFLAADHADWVTFRGDDPSPVETAVTAWMRVHLMGDMALRPWFYGPTCTLCSDSAWQIRRTQMDQ
jgi:hypothetical protein